MLNLKTSIILCSIHVFFSFFNATVYTYIILLLNSLHKIMLIHYGVIMTLNSIIGIFTILTLSFFINRLKINLKLSLPYILIFLAIMPLLLSFYFTEYYLWLLPATLLTLTIAQSLQMLILPTLIPTMVLQKALYSTNSLLYFLNYGFMLFSPILATLIFIQEYELLFVSSISIALIIFITILTVLNFDKNPPEEMNLKSDMSYITCINYLRAKKKLVIVLLLFIFTKPIFSVITILWPSYFLEKNDVIYYGLVDSSAIIGMIIAALIAKLINYDKYHFIIVFIGLAICSITVILIGSASLLWMFITLNFVLGASIAISDISHQTIWHQSIPMAMQAKIFTIRIIAPTISTLPIQLLTLYLVNSYLVNNPTTNKILETYSLLYWLAGFSALLIIVLLAFYYNNSGNT